MREIIAKPSGHCGFGGEVADLELNAEIRVLAVAHGRRSPGTGESHLKTGFWQRRESLYLFCTCSWRRRHGQDEICQHEYVCRPPRWDPNLGKQGQPTNGDRIGDFRFSCHTTRDDAAQEREHAAQEEIHKKHRCTEDRGELASTTPPGAQDPGPRPTRRRPRSRMRRPSHQATPGRLPSADRLATQQSSNLTPTIISDLARPVRRTLETSTSVGRLNEPNPEHISSEPDVATPSALGCSVSRRQPYLERCRHPVYPTRARIQAIGGRQRSA
jgi:hypothetical protein